MAEATSPWAFLHGWWGVLEGAIMIKPKPRRGSLQTAFRSLEVVVPDAFTRERWLWLEQRDALELVFLQLRVDPMAFVTMARASHSTFDQTDVMWGNFHGDEAFPCRVELVLEQLQFLGGDPSWALWLLSALLQPVPLEAHSEHFRLARAKMVAMASETVVNEWTIQVDIRLQFPHETVMVAVLDHVVKLRQSMDAALQVTRDADEETRRAALRGFPFRAACIDVELSGMEISATLNDALTRVAMTPGLELRDVHCHGVQRLPRQRLGAFVEALTKARAPRIEEDHDSEASLHFSPRGRRDAMSLMEIMHLLSALQQRNRFQSVVLQPELDDFNRVDRRVVWLWIVFLADRREPLHDFARAQDEQPEERRYCDTTREHSSQKPHAVVVPSQMATFRRLRH